jgi:hypothetical protein
MSDKVNLMEMNRIHGRALRVIHSAQDDIVFRKWVGER